MEMPTMQYFDKIICCFKNVVYICIKKQGQQQNLYTMTQNEIDNLITWVENNAKCRTYAESIVKAEREMRDAQRILSNNYEVWTPSEWLDFCSKVENMRRSVVMKIKHFFDMVYGKGNIFCQTLKGKDDVDHWMTFREFAHNQYCNCEM